MSTPTSGNLPTAPLAPSETGEYTHAQILTILVGLMMGMFLGALDQTIVSTSIRTIADDLNGLSVQAWVTTAYLITSTIATPIYGKLGDLYGRKKLFMFAISVFIIGSALCSFATSMYMLAAFRAVQGIGAGGLFTLVLAIIGDIVSPRERARYTGYFMAVFGTSSVLGPVIGGFFAGHAVILGLTGWRWVFLVNVPIGIAALIVVYRTLHLSHQRRDAPHRLVGCGHPRGRPGPAAHHRRAGTGVGMGLAARPGLLPARRGRPRSPSSTPSARMGDDALIPLRMFRFRTVAVGIVASVIVGAAMFGGILVIPLYMQIVHGASPMRSGFLMLPMVVGMMSASIISGQVISRTGRIRPFPLIGSALICIALFLLSRITADTNLLLVMGVMFGLGYGLGNCMQPLLLILQSAVPPRDIGVATSRPPSSARSAARWVWRSSCRSSSAASVGQHQDLDRLRVADPGVPAGRADGVPEPEPARPSGRRGVPAPDARGRRAGARCRTTRRSSSRCRRCSPTRSRPASPSRWTPSSCSPAAWRSWRSWCCC